MRLNKLSLAAVAVSLLCLTGCATKLSKPASLPSPTTVRLDDFQNVEMKSVSISSAYAKNSANQKAMKKIDEILFQEMLMTFPNLKRIGSGEEFSDSGERTLQITPLIKEIKFIGGAARFWAGAMAGSSAVLMQVTYRDSANGEEVANPEFYRAAGAHAGGWTVGMTDNRMLEDIADDIVTYTSRNR